jgi:D-serine deaminase-like pyridoxal phosphate-dependent protein
VSTLSEAEFFAEAGFDDILYGYPLMEHHMERNFVLADKLDEYHVMVASNESVDLLLKMDPPAGKKWFIFFAHLKNLPKALFCNSTIAVPCH